MIEDAVTQVLAARAEGAPMRVDGPGMLERVDRRRRTRARGQALVAAAAVGVLVAGGAVWGATARTGSHDGAARVPAASSTPTPSGTEGALRTATWNALQFDVPADWKVDDVQFVHPGPPDALREGPFIGTLRVGPLCRTNSDGSGVCGRSQGILDRRPKDGVVAWIDAGRVSAGLPGADDRDPGPSTGVCPPSGTIFHAFRLIEDRGPEGPRATYRVTVDGCAYGPRTSTYLAQLQAVAASVQVIH